MFPTMKVCGLKKNWGSRGNTWVVSLIHCYISFVLEQDNTMNTAWDEYTFSVRLLKKMKVVFVFEVNLFDNLESVVFCRFHNSYLYFNYCL